MKFTKGVIWNRLLVEVACVLLLLSFPILVHAQNEASEADTEFDKEFKKTSQIIVMMEFGAGIIFGREKDRLLIATAYHVVNKGSQHPLERVMLKSMPGKPLNATLLKFDAAADLAVLSIEKQGINVCALPFDRLGNVAQLKRKDPVSAVGNPNGVAWAMPVEPDKVSEITRNGIVFQSNFIGKGHSGGALLNEKAAVVGMILADEPPFGRAMRIDAVLQIAQQWGYAVTLQAPPLDAGKTLLHGAAKNGDVAAVKNLLTVCGNIHAKDDFGATPLAWAAWSGSIESMQLLLKAGTNLNVTDNDGDTLLHWAVQGREIQSMRFLVQAGARVNAPNNTKKTPLHLAIDYRLRQPKWTFEEKPQWLDLINFLVGAGAKIEAAALFDLFAKGEIEGLKVLLKAVSDLNAKIDREESLVDLKGTLLHTAARRGQLDIVELLLKLGADVNATNQLGSTPLDLARNENRDDVVKVLLKAGAKSSR